MPFRSWLSYQKFQAAVTNSTRYIFTEETEQFLDEVLKTCESRQRTIAKGSIVWRAQRGDTRPIYDDENNEIAEESCPHPVGRMKPLKFSANEGRANPKGIPCLYTATSKETAMSEVRPWVGSEISVAQFKVKRKLSVIDCPVSHSENPFYFDIDCGFYEPSDDEKEKAVWAHIDGAFSKPVVENENRTYYAPTQIIAELFKNEEFDGVVYKSMLSDGYNIALFDPEVVEMLNCFLFETKKIIFEFCEAANPYFIKS